MEVTEIRVQNYRSIDDSGWVSLDDLTCLIGRNESGKTAFMKALERLNPSYLVEEYTPYQDYPRDEWPAYKQESGDDPAVVASGRFVLEESDLEAIEAAYGRTLIAEPEGVVRRNYENELEWELDLDDEAVLAHLREEYDLEADLEEQLEDTSSISDLEEATTAELRSALDGDPKSVVTADIGSELLQERLPEFRYVGEYSTMEGTIDVEELLEKRDEGTLTPPDRVFLALLSVADLDLEAFRDVDDWREQTAELEAASAAVSDAAMEYWSQSGDIRIRINATTTTEDGEDRQVLDLRVENRTHDVTVEFEQRSHGFRRFFSTFCQLFELRNGDRDQILLLDEPGLNLHARAKQEFLQFLKTEIAPEHPIVYTTHSPFMIDPENLDRTKMVRPHPLGEENVFDDVSLADDYTRFPLRNVFELDLMDTLLVRQYALLVERKADHIYLYVLSKMLQDLGEDGLDSRWTVVPIKDAANIDRFVALFGGEKLDVAALLDDVPPSVHAAGDGVRDEPEERHVRIEQISEYTDAGGESTIEDVLSVPFYLEIVNQAYASAIADAGGIPDRIPADELRVDDRPIVEALRSYFETHDIGGGEFDRDVPALYLQENRDELIDDLDRESRRNFTRLFTALDNTLESFEGVESRQQSFLSALGLGR